MASPPCKHANIIKNIELREMKKIMLYIADIYEWVREIVGILKLCRYTIVPHRSCCVMIILWVWERYLWIAAIKFAVMWLHWVYLYMRECIVGCHKLSSLRIHIYVCAMYIIIRSFVVVVVVIGVVSWDGDYCFLIFVCNALVKWILWIFIVTRHGEALMRTIH